MNQTRPINEARQILEQCITKCLDTETALLKLNNVEQYERAIKLCVDCADICSLALAFLERESIFIIHSIHLCYAVCSECFEECSLHIKTLIECDECAKICQKASKFCEKLNMQQLNTLNAQ
jgi:hypothetical protein